MNKIIKVIGMGTPEETRTSIKRIVDQLEKNNYAITDDANANRLFSRFIPRVYKRNGIILFSKPNYHSNGLIITLKPDYEIERKDSYSFFIRVKK